MRVAALSDIHGNLPALEAVLDRVRQAAVDRIVVGGDVVPGSMVDQAHDFATNNVLDPPSEERMLELFARAELRYQ